MKTLNEMYATLTDSAPETELARHVWSGLANTYYLRVKMGLGPTNTEQMREIYNLAKQYDIEVPSKQLLEWLEFMENLREGSQDSALDTDTVPVNTFSKLKTEIKNEREKQYGA